MPSKSMHIVLTGGGTAGHLFPGLATAAALQAMTAARITFVGSGKDFERRLVTQAGFDYECVPCAPASRSPGDMVRFMSRNVSGYRESLALLRERRVSVVVGLGGYASAPTAIAAVRSGVPLVLLEQNAMPGRVTRWLASSAHVVCAAFDEVRKHLSATNVRVTGNPLRAGFDQGKPPRRAANRNLLILGGSGGSRQLNEHVPKVLYKLRDQLSGWRIIHQAGGDHFHGAADLYRKLAVDARVVPLIANMPEVLPRIDLAISRAGGTTLAELLACGVPSLLIPFPEASDNHQRKNAEAIAVSGAARVVDARDHGDAFPKVLSAELAALLTDSVQRAAMSTAAQRHSRPDAAQIVAQTILNVADGLLWRSVA